MEEAVDTAHVNLEMVSLTQIPVVIFAFCIPHKLTYLCHTYAIINYRLTCTVWTLRTLSLTHHTEWCQLQCRCYEYCLPCVLS